MKTVQLKNGIIAGLVILIFSICLFTCHQQSPQTADNPNISTDTLFLYQWRAERNAKEQLVKEYEKTINVLEDKNFTLSKLNSSNKLQLRYYRTKEILLTKNLQSYINDLANKDSCVNDSIIPLINELTEFRDSANNQCDTTITLLEQQLINRDSLLLLRKQIEIQLRDFNKEQALQNNYLTNQLNTAYKQQKKKSRQNKLLAGGLLILSGITTSILLIHSQR